MTSRQIIDAILDKIREKGFHPIDISYGNGYFIFEYGEDTVCHFRIRENRGFRFGIWTKNLYECDNNAVAQVFAQYERNIDKFKPSRSFYCEKVWKWINDPTPEDLAYWDVQDMVKEIAKHRFVAFYKDSRDFKWQVNGLLAFWAFCSFNVDHFFKFIFKWILNYCQICDTWLKLFWMQQKDKRILEFKIIDEDKHMPGWHSSPQFQPWLLVTDDFPDEEAERIESEFWHWRMRKSDNEISFPRFFKGEFPPMVMELDDEEAPEEAQPEEVEGPEDDTAVLSVDEAAAMLEETGCGENQ